MARGTKNNYNRN